jgi:hypothetical protein
MIALTEIRKLDLRAAATSDRPSHLSAASGLVCVGSLIYVVADDELHLGVFGASASAPGHLLRLFDGVLPGAQSARKQQKPDLEALVLLPAFADYPDGALLALGSGSTHRRRAGALMSLDPHGVVQGSARAIELSPLLARLDNEFSALNIEGAVVVGDELRLFQRGNSRPPDNAIIRFRLTAVLDALISGRAGAIGPLAVHRCDLGALDGIPFCFTDATVLPTGEMVVTAVAEDTDNPYDDGGCVGALVGLFDRDGTRPRLHRLAATCKVEGVDARVDGDVVRLLLVTDADDPAVPAALYSATIPQ